MPIQTRSMTKRTKEEQRLREERRLHEHEEMRLIEQQIYEKEDMVRKRLKEIEQKQCLTTDDIEFIRIHGLIYSNIFTLTYDKIKCNIISLLNEVEFLNKIKQYNKITKNIIKIYRETEKLLFISQFSTHMDIFIERISLNKLNELKDNLKTNMSISQENKNKINREFQRYINSLTQNKVKLNK